ncbi:MAG TPA: SGNH/GDSL hydrolase family protein [Gemmatimonadaceae bacterium]|nr:SGNH/GDSL hydrolase family protein [Gemmatimonadaceae bacterium]
MSLSFLALGDSYTIGEGVDEQDRWPVQLARALRDAGRDIEDPRIIARTGWTTDELMEAIDASGVTGDWDLVTLLAGVNDQYRGYEPDRYQESFSAMVGCALGFAKLPERLLVLSIPDWGITPFAEGRDRQAIGKQIDIFNSIAADLAFGVGSQFVNITPLTRLSATQPGLLVSDGLHPSGEAYRMWVGKVLPVAARALDVS